MQKERIRMHDQEEQNKNQSEFIQRKSLCQLIYKNKYSCEIMIPEQWKPTFRIWKPPLIGLTTIHKKLNQ